MAPAGTPTLTKQGLTLVEPSRSARESERSESCGKRFIYLQEGQPARIIRPLRRCFAHKPPTPGMGDLEQSPVMRHMSEGKNGLEEVGSDATSYRENVWDSVGPIILTSPKIRDTRLASAFL